MSEKTSIMLKIQEEIYSVRENYLKPKYVLLSFKSYEKLVSETENYKRHISGDDTSSMIFPEKINLTGDVLEIVIVEFPDVKLPDDFVRVVPGPQERFLREKR